MPHVPVRGALTPAASPAADVAGAGPRLLGYATGGARCPRYWPAGSSGWQIARVRLSGASASGVRDARSGSVRRLLIGALVAAAVATPAAAEDPPPPPALRFVTLNVLHGGPLSGWTGRDSHLEARLDLVSEALRALAPDVVALQEASWSRDRGEVAARLAGRLGLNHVYAPSSMRLFDTGWFNRAAAALMDFSEGPAILSRFPIVRSESHKLPRAAGGSTRASSSSPSWPPPAGRCRCSRRTPAATTAMRRPLPRSSVSARATCPGVLMGDLNAVESSAAIRGLVSEVGPGRRVPRRAPGRAGVHGLAAGDRARAARLPAGRLRVPRPRAALPGRRRGEPRRRRHPGPAARWQALWPSDHYGVLADLIVFPPIRSGTGGARMAATSRISALQATLGAATLPGCVTREPRARVPLPHDDRTEHRASARDRDLVHATRRPPLPRRRDRGARALGDEPRARTPACGGASAGGPSRGAPASSSPVRERALAAAVRARPRPSTAGATA